MSHADGNSRIMEGTIAIRPTQPHEYEAVAFTKSVALLQTPKVGEAFEPLRASYAVAPSLSAWDGDTCVGHAAQFLVDTMVPGGAMLPTGAVTRVGVLPTHRRRRVASGLLEGLIADAVDRRLALMSLRASQATIYGRFGFGVAGDFASVKIDPKAATPVRGADTTGSFRLLPADEIMSVIPPLYPKIAMRRPGRITRPIEFDRNFIYDEAITLSSASYVVVHLDEHGTPDGFVSYSLKANDDFTVLRGELHDIFSGTDAGELALWQFLFDIDLVNEWTADERPVDDLARWASNDIRAYQVKSIDDEQWVRLVDVDRCLQARSYGSANGSVVISVIDNIIDDNSHRWRISADGANRTDEPADLIAPIEALSAAYLGGRSWHVLAVTAGVECLREDAMTEADTLFATNPLPHCGTFF
ncbi:MAG TPA: GNAT family N-acetyltransferase [Ilumatobacter sp.]|nr:GNAT family N-acetyltransferase [Ilumatobacter sp.]